MVEESPEEIERRAREREAKIQRLRSALDRESKVARIERKERLVDSTKVTALVLVGILGFAGLAWGYFKVSESLEDGCQFHEHATFRVVDRGEILRFQHPRFDMKNMAMRAHLHQTDDSKIHLEGECANVREFFGLMGMSIKSDRLKLDDTLHDGKVLREEGNETLRFFLYRETAGNWTWEEYPRLLGHQLRDGQRMLVLFGNYSDEEIVAFQEQVPVVEAQ